MTTAAAKVLPSSRPQTTHKVQYRAHFWYFKSYAQAAAFAKKFSQ